MPKIDLFYHIRVSLINIFSTINADNCNLISIFKAKYEQQKIKKFKKYK